MRHQSSFTSISAILICLTMTGCWGGEGVGGALPRLCTLNPGDPLPAKLSQTGIFSDIDSLTPAPGAREYHIIAPLWSDGALKQRWMWLPPNAQIGFSANGAWEFPPGACFAKQFNLNLEPASRNGRIVRLETRVLIRRATDWIGYTYQWNNAQTEADLLTESATKVFEISDPEAVGGKRLQTWNFPSRGQCLFCHNRNAGGALGVRTAQINRAVSGESGHGGLTTLAGEENQLSRWNRLGLFQNDIGDPSQYTSYVNPLDTSHSLTLRARSYLVTNCAHCHQPGGPAPVDMDFRFETLPEAMRVFHVHPTQGDLGVTGSLRIDPGHRETSVLWLRMMDTSFYRMPFLGSNVVDPAGTEIVGAWIDQLKNH